MRSAPAIPPRQFRPGNNDGRTFAAGKIGRVWSPAFRRFPCLPANDVPNVPNVPPAEAGTPNLPAGELLPSLGQVSPRAGERFPRTGRTSHRVGGDSPGAGGSPPSLGRVPTNAGGNSPSPGGSFPNAGERFPGPVLTFPRAGFSGKQAPQPFQPQINQPRNQKNKERMADHGKSRLPAGQ